MEIRLLTPKDVTRNVLDVVNSLSDTTHLSIMDAKLIVLEKMYLGHNTYVGYFDENPTCIGSLYITPRLIHNGKRVGHLEDIAVHKNQQKKGYGRKIVEFLLDKANEYSVYKVILDCDLELIPYYERFGFYRDGFCMRKDV